MQRNKYLWSAVLVLLVMLILLPTAAFADRTIVDSGTCGAQGDNLTWTLFDDGELVIMGMGDMADYRLSGNPAPWFVPLDGSNYWSGNSNTITSLTVEEGVTSIGEWAFSNCTELIAISLPHSIREIYGNAFRECESLTAIVLPEGLKTLHGSSFHGTNLHEITFPASLQDCMWGDGATFEGSPLQNIYVASDNPLYYSMDGVVFSKDKTTLIMFPNGRTGSYAIPEGVTCIGFRAFHGSRLNTVSVSSDVTEIRGYAFLSASELQTVLISDGLSQIDEGAFSYTGSSLMAFQVDSANSVFSSIDGVLLNKEQTLLIQCPAGKTGDYSVPEKVTSIGNNAFSSSKLRSISIPNSVINIGNSAFSNCQELTEIRVADGNPAYCTMDGCLYSADGKTILCCPGGKSGDYTIPNGVTVIENSAFSGCSKLTSVSISDSIVSIGNMAFAECFRLARLIFVGDLPVIQNYTFSGEIVVLYPANNDTYTSETMQNYGGRLTWIPYSYDSVLSAGTCGAQGNNLTWTLYSDGELVIEGIGCMEDYDVEKREYAPWYNQRGLIETATFEDGVTGIGICAFYNCGRLTSTTIPDSVISIGDHAFCCSSLTSVSIPDSITDIGYGVFDACCNLTSITISKNVTSIGNSMFHNCFSLTSVLIPDGVTSIGIHAFAYCDGLTSISFTGDLPTISDDAFVQVTATVYYPANNPTYTADKMQNYGGSLTWVAVPSPDGILPASLKTLQDEALSGCAFRYVVIPDGVTSVGKRAFADSSKLEYVSIPASVTEIAPDAFDGAPNGLTIIGQAGSTAERFATDKGTSFVPAA